MIAITTSISTSVKAKQFLDPSRRATGASLPSIGRISSDANILAFLGAFDHVVADKTDYFVAKGQVATSRLALIYGALRQRTAWGG